MHTLIVTSLSWERNCSGLLGQCTDTDKVAAISTKPVRAPGTDTDKVAAISIELIRATGMDMNIQTIIVVQISCTQGKTSLCEICLGQGKARQGEARKNL